MNRLSTSFLKTLVSFLVFFGLILLVSGLLKLGEMLFGANTCLSTLPVFLTFFLISFFIDFIISGEKQ